MKIFNWLFLSFLLLKNNVEASPGQILRCGWYSWEPYQYIEQQVGSKQLTGLDVHILNAIINIAGYKITYEEISWQQHQERLKIGNYDIAMGATKIDEREKHYYFTEPYRESIDALFILTDSSKKPTFQNAIEFIREIKQKKFKLGVTEGYFYSVPELNDFINDKNYQNLIVKSNNTISNMMLLETKQIDGFLADHVNGTTIAWRKRMHEKIKTYEISRSPIYFMLSKNSLSAKDLKNINEAILSFKRSNDYNAVFKTYLIAPLLLQNIDKKWFYLIDIIGTIAFALSGIIIAYRMRSTLFTTITLAMLPAIGGGMMRDIIVGRRPLGVLQTPDYLFAVLSTVFTCYIILQFLSVVSSKSRFYPKVLLNKKFLIRALDVFDALGLAAFTVIGTKVAVISKCEPLWLWGPLLAAITGAGGGVIRDLLRPDRHVTSFMGELYAEVAIIWSFFLSIFLHFHHTYLSPDEVLWAIIITIVGVFVTRMGASIFNLKGPNLSSRFSS
ncbi:MAG: hypothetical protein BGO77_07665 [Caedibacter sp. 37-49]|nr:MAG: hypothetical protein BGO77_07665 [Caedibacter sp. 37-49]